MEPQQIGKIIKQEARKELQPISTPQFDIEKAKAHYLNVGKQLISPDFSFICRDELFEIIIKYFLQVPGETYDLKKGIHITGDVGTGKTTMMRVFQRAFQKNPFKIVSARHISRDIVSSDKPMQIIDEYGRHSYRKTQYGHIDHQKPITVCFDDLGSELASVKHYGNNLPVMEDIIQDRYIEFTERGLISHFTTNLDGQMIEDTYGKRTRDRIKEMCNVIVMDGESLRK